MFFLRFLWDLIVVFFFFILFLVCVSAAMGAEDTNPSGHAQVTVYSWVGSGNGGAYATTIQTNSCMRTVRHFLQDGEEWPDNIILDRAVRGRDVLCWDKTGSLIWRTEAFVYPAVNNASCVGRNSWTGLHIIDRCKNSDSTIRQKVGFGDLEEVLVDE
jgi:hypothetical protein